MIASVEELLKERGYLSDFPTHPIRLLSSEYPQKPNPGYHRKAASPKGAKRKEEDRSKEVMKKIKVVLMK